MCSSVLWYKVTNVSEEPAASIFSEKKKAAGSTGTLVTFYQTTQCHIPKNNNLRITKMFSTICHNAFWVNVLSWTQNPNFILHSAGGRVGRPIFRRSVCVWTKKSVPRKITIRIYLGTHVLQQGTPTPNHWGVAMYCGMYAREVDVTRLRKRALLGNG
jgi:hypothetical protein